MDLDDCPKDSLGLPVPPFPITTVKREQWNLWLLGRIWSKEIPATEDDLDRWRESVRVKNPTSEESDVTSQCSPARYGQDGGARPKVQSSKSPSEDEEQGLRWWNR